MESETAKNDTQGYQVCNIEIIFELLQILKSIIPIHFIIIISRCPHLK